MYVSTRQSGQRTSRGNHSLKREYVTDVDITILNSSQNCEQIKSNINIKCRKPTIGPALIGRLDWGFDVLVNFPSA